MKISISDKIHIEFTVKKSASLAWECLTHQEHITKWWGDNITLENKQGGKFIEKWSNGSRKVTTVGEIIKFDPPRLLEMTWIDDDWPGATRVKFTISDLDEETLLILEHSDWEIHDKPKRMKLIQEHAKGWDYHMKNLKKHLDSLQSSQSF